MLLRLEEPTLGVLRLEPRYGFRPSRLDLGFPTARAVSEDRVNAHGTIDSTQLYGSRAVTMSVAVVGNSDGESGWPYRRRDLLDRLRAFLNPGRRSYLYIDDEDGTAERRVLLRGDSAGAPIETPGYAEVSLGWVAPEGILELGTQLLVPVPAVPPSPAGRSYPRRYPLRYPRFSAAGAQGVVNIGTEPAAPIYRIFASKNPAIINPDTATVLAFGGTALTGTVQLVGSQYIEVDVRNATAYYNGDRTQSAYGSIDFARSSFAWLAPGSNRLRLVSETQDPAARVDVLYRPAWI
ncbi:hypothetical protein ACFFKU_06835 [Kineococcus gynurae]|uniref:Siphovirus-type tail component C-terminal domain-containing protein n=1 Tax=Kineococcus gynurae TaxID=452979 RepID=A0ABV5LWY2_9ACTN